MSDITEEDVMKYCQSRNLMLVTKESLEYMHRPIVIENAPTVNAIPIEWIKNVWLKNPDNQGEIDFFPPATFEVVMNWLIEDWEKENEK